MTQAGFRDGAKVCGADDLLFCLEVEVGEGVQDRTSLSVYLSCPQTSQRCLLWVGSGRDASWLALRHVVGRSRRCRVGVKLPIVGSIHALESKSEKAIADRLPYLVQHPREDQNAEYRFAGGSDKVEKQDCSEGEHEDGHHERAKGQLPKLRQKVILVGIDISDFHDSDLRKAHLPQELVDLRGDLVGRGRGRFGPCDDS